MAKDPAFLFYYQDFLVGTTFMTLEERGAYITLLCFQAAKGPLSEADILKKIPPSIWEAICCKFVCKDGVYINERLAEETKKRRLYCENRRNNLHMDKHMEKHMKGVMTAHMENENENINKDKDNNDKGGMGGKFEEFWELYPKKVGMNMAILTFRATIKTEKDFEDLKIALKNYIASEEYKKGFIKRGDNWIEDWRGWLRMTPKSQVKREPTPIPTLPKDVFKGGAKEDIEKVFKT